MNRQQGKVNSPELTSIDRDLTRLPMSHHGVTWANYRIDSLELNGLYSAQNSFSVDY